MEVDEVKGIDYCKIFSYNSTKVPSIGVVTSRGRHGSSKIFSGVVAMDGLRSFLAWSPWMD